MNICFLIGKIISNIEYEFILNSKNISIVNFYLQLENKNIIKIKTYDELADKCYNSLLKNDIVAIEGIIDSNMEIIINNFIFIK